MIPDDIEFGVEVLSALRDMRAILLRAGDPRTLDPEFNRRLAAIDTALAEAGKALDRRYNRATRDSALRQAEREHGT